MAKDPGSKDRSLEALDFIINVLKEHEQNLDKLINQLATVTEQIGDIDALNGKVENVEEKINIMQKEVTNLIGSMSNAPKEALQAAVKEQELQAQATPAVSLGVVQGGTSVILRCKQWEDFEVLAMHAQALTFSYNEDEKVFQADALKGNQIIKYTGALPNFSIILKTWLSRQLAITERNILEGFLDKPK
jgi:seryl-tRNA synthetase